MAEMMSPPRLLRAPQRRGSASGAIASSMKRISSALEFSGAWHFALTMKEEKDSIPILNSPTLRAGLSRLLRRHLPQSSRADPSGWAVSPRWPPGVPW